MSAASELRQMLFMPPLTPVAKDESEKLKGEAMEPRQPADTTVVIIDDNTLLRNGVLMKKFFFKPGDSIDRSYGWMKAPEASP